MRALLVLALLAAGCSSGGGGDDDDDMASPTPLDVTFSGGVIPILNDFVQLKANAKLPGYKQVVGSLPGYLIAAFGKSIPKQLLRKADAEVRVINAGGRVYRCTPNGVEARDIAPGQPLYEGPVRMLSAGTVPYYGFKFRMFPFSRHSRGLMQLRIARTGVGEAVSHLVGIWRGTYQTPTIEDWLVEAVQVRFSESMPFQVGGDAAGYRREITFGVAPEPFEALSLSREHGILAA